MPIGTDWLPSCTYYILHLRHTGSLAAACRCDRRSWSRNFDLCISPATFFRVKRSWYCKLALQKLYVIMNMILVAAIATFCLLQVRFNSMLCTEYRADFLNPWAAQSGVLSTIYPQKSFRGGVQRVTTQYRLGWSTWREILFPAFFARMY